MSGRCWAGLGLLLLAAFLVRLGGALWWQHRLNNPQGFFFPDSHSYWHLARTIASGEPYQYGSPDARVFRTPGYPMVLAVVFWLAGPEPPVLVGRILGAGLGITVVGCCWWMGRRVFGPQAGWWAGVLAAFYPEAVAASMLILSEALFCPVMCLQLLMLLLAWQTPQARKALGYALVSGLLGGFGVLVRPSWLCFTPLAAIGGVIGCLKIFGRGISSSRQPGAGESLAPSGGGRGGFPTLGLRLAMAGLMLAGMLGVMGPWWIRNYQRVGRFVPTTLQVGASLYDGLHPTADGQSNMQFVQEFADSERWLLHYRGPKVCILDPGKWESVRKSAGSEAEASSEAIPDAESSAVAWEYWLDQAMAAEAVQWACRHPKEVLRLAWRKLLRMWNPWPNEPTLSAWPMGAVVGGTYLPVLAAGLLGVGRAGRRGEPWVLFVLPTLYLSLVHSIFVSSLRYRGPAMLGWIVLGAGWAAEKIPLPIRSQGLGQEVKPRIAC